MFRLPVCPYCHTVYRYGDVKKVSKKKQEKCYHCKNDFKISKLRIWVLLLIIVVIGVALNVFQLSNFENMSFAVMFVSNIVLILAAVLFLPYFIKFKRK